MWESSALWQKQAKHTSAKHSSETLSIPTIVGVFQKKKINTSCTHTQAHTHHTHTHVMCIRVYIHNLSSPDPLNLSNTIPCLRVYIRTNIQVCVSSQPDNSHHPTFPHIAPFSPSSFESTANVEHQAAVVAACVGVCVCVCVCCVCVCVCQCVSYARAYACSYVSLMRNFFKYDAPHTHTQTQTRPRSAGLWWSSLYSSSTMRTHA